MASGKQIQRIVYIKIEWISIDWCTNNDFHVEKFCSYFIHSFLIWINSFEFVFFLFVSLPSCDLRMYIVEILSSECVYSNWYFWNRTNWIISILVGVIELTPWFIYNKNRMIYIFCVFFSSFCYVFHFRSRQLVIW